MEMDIAIKSLSEFKLNLRTVISNLKKLEEGSLSDGQFSEHTKKLVMQTDVLIAKLENTSASRILKIVAKRKKLRKLKKSRKERELSKVEATKEENESEGILERSTSIIAIMTDEIQNRREVHQNVKLHQQLRQYHDAKKFLRRFELLKELHLARSQDANATQQFVSQLTNLQSTWNGILQANTPKPSRKRRLEDQWNEAFFGAKEHNLNNSDRKLTDFIRIRDIWDTYLTNDLENGSCIPIGWVLPNAQADDRWLTYRALPTNALEISSSAFLTSDNLMTEI